MTPEEINRERQTAREALRDVRHPYHAGAMVMRGSYMLADDKTRAFMRAIAPYFFEADGTLIQPGANES